MQRRALLSALAFLMPAKAFAMYDPEPHTALKSAPGAWTGTLTYRDWSNPDKLVTLPCTLSVTLTAPDELAFYYVFDDGPGKIVHSYARMNFNFKSNSLTWVSGHTKPTTSQYKITNTVVDTEGTELVFERTVENRTDKFVFMLRKSTFSFKKTEVSASGTAIFRNKYEFRRTAL